MLKIQFKSNKGSFRSNKHKYFNIKLLIASIYCPVEKKKHNEMIDFISNNLNNIPPSSHVILEQDSNTKVRIARISTEEIVETNISKFSTKELNTKGENLLNTMKAN